MNPSTWTTDASSLPLRRRVFNLLNPRDGRRSGGFGLSQDKGSFLVEIALVAVVAINSTSLILWTVPGFRADFDLWFHLVEDVTVAVFLAEYALRLWSAPEADSEGSPWRQRWRYVVSPVALIDAAALAPSAVAAGMLLAGTGGPSLSFLLAVRLLTRTVKLVRYFPGGRLIATVIRQRASQLLATVGGLILVLVIAAALMYFAETNAQPDEFSSIPAAMWWSVVTLTTVGYGDTVPITPAGRALAAVIAVLGIGLFALPAGILSAGLREADVENRAAVMNESAAGGGAICPHCGQPMPDADSD